jgi:hypothetical protein
MANKEMIDIDKFRELEVLGKVLISTLQDGSVLIQAAYTDELGNLTPKDIGKVTALDLQQEVDALEKRANDYKALSVQLFGESPTTLKGMTPLDFLWGRFYENEVFGAYQIAFSNGIMAAFLAAIGMSRPDDWGRYVVLQNPLVIMGVPVVFNILESAGVIQQGQASIRAAQVLDQKWVKPA